MKNLLAASIALALVVIGSFAVPILSRAARPLLGPGSSVTHADLQSCWVRLDDDPADYATIQAAVDAAHDGDTVKVAGYCSSTAGSASLAQLVYLSKTLTIQGGYTTTNWTAPDPAANPTTLDAQGNGRVIYITPPGASDNVSPTIQGLHITGGDADGLGGGSSGEDAGGGVYVISATVSLRACKITSNTADGAGGGLYLLNSDNATLSGNVIFSNTSGLGSGVYMGQSASVTFNDNTIQDNGYIDQYWAGWGSYGGGLYLGQSPSVTLDGNIIQGNEATGGGGIFLWDGDSAILSDNVIQNNMAYGVGRGGPSDGGGLYLHGDNATLSGNTILSNTGLLGGGVYLAGDNATLSSNIVWGNEATGGGGGVCLHGDNATLDGNIIRANIADGGGGVCLEGGDNATLSNNVILGNTASGSWGNGGGLYIHNHYHAPFNNNVGADNQAHTAGSGLYVQGSSSRLLHTTIARNTGGDGSGIYIRGSSMTLTNTILAGHTVGITLTGDSTATVEATLWGTATWANAADWGGAGAIITGAVNFWGDPVFTCTGSLCIAPYHVGPGSAALDVGVDAGIGIDVDYEPRPWRLPDLGADEYWPPGMPRYVFLPLLQRSE